MKIQSSKGSIELLDKGVVIHRKGGMSGFASGTVTIPFDKIQSVNFKPSGGRAGFVRIAAAGTSGGELSPNHKTYDELKDPNALVFTKWSHNKEFQAFVDELNRRLLS